MHASLWPEKLKRFFSKDSRNNEGSGFNRKLLSTNLFPAKYDIAEIKRLVKEFEKNLLSKMRLTSYGRIPLCIRLLATHSVECAARKTKSYSTCKYLLDVSQTKFFETLSHPETPFKNLQGYLKRSSAEY